jgi:hypothetical protein
MQQTLARNSIWVYSTARSGSSWLALDVLCWDQLTRPMDEPGFGSMFAPIEWDAERFYDLPSRPAHFPSGLDYEKGVLVREGTFGVTPFERSYIFARQENKIWNLRNWHVYIDLLRETVFQNVLNEWGVMGYERLVFKMPNDSHAADVIMQAFPDSFMIFLMRDGRDVMKSRFSPFASKKLAETDDSELRRYAIAFYSHFWNFQVDIMKSAYAAHAPERKLLLRYEDIRREPFKYFRNMFNRVGAPMSDDQLAAMIEATTLEKMPEDQKGPDKPRQTGQVGRFGDTFTADEISLMEAIMGPNLEQFGYDLCNPILAAQRRQPWLKGNGRILGKPSGLYSDGWVAPRLAFTIQPDAPVAQIGLHVWVPDDIPSGGQLTLRAADQVEVVELASGNLTLQLALNDTDTKILVTAEGTKWVKPEGPDGRALVFVIKELELVHPASQSVDSDDGGLSEVN